MCIKTAAFGWLLLIMLSGTVAIGQPIDAKPAMVQSVDDLADPLIETGRAKGLSIGIVQKNAAGEYETQTFHLGKTGHGKKTPDDETLYEIGSISKVFTGILAADRIIADDVTLQSPANDLLTGDNPLPSFAEQPITILNMSTHRSSLPRLAPNMSLVEMNDPYQKYDRKQADEFLASYELPVAPGTRYEYSNFAVGYLGNLLMRSQDFPTYDAMMESRLTGPLEMNATRVVVDEDSSAFAIGHDVGGQPVDRWHFADMPGAGGIRSNLSDMNRFMLANLAPPDGITGKAIELAFQKQVDASGPDLAMGLGWLIARDQVTRFHNGQTGGYASAVFINRPLGLGVCVLSNSSIEPITELAEKLVQWKAGMPVPVPVVPTIAEVSTDEIDRCVGQYELAPTFVFDVRREGTRLLVGITNQPTLEVFPTSPTKWFYRAVDARLIFGDLKDGKAQTLTLDQNGLMQVARRIGD